MLPDPSSSARFGVRRDKVRLTKQVVRAAQPDLRPYFLPDSGPDAVPGFALRVYPGGKKTFVLRYRPAGRASAQTVISIGEFGPLTVDDARKRALQVRADVVAMRDDPARDVRRRRKDTRAQRIAERAAPTVSELFDGYLAEKETEGLAAGSLEVLRYQLGSRVHKKGAKRGESVPSPMREAFGKVRAADLDRSQVRAFYETRRAAYPAAARRAVKLLRSVYTWAMSEGLVPQGCMPAAGVKLAKQARPKRQALSSIEYAAFGAALRSAEHEGVAVAPSRQQRSRGMSAVRRAALTGRKRAPYAKSETAGDTRRRLNPIAVDCLRFLALTGWRKSEARTLTWSALDRERREAILRDTKTGESVRPIGDEVWSLLEQIKTRRAGIELGLFVFPRLDDASLPLRELAGVWENVKHAASLPPAFTPHGLRHSFITVARELGYGDHVIAALVGHEMGASQTGRYGLAPTGVVADAATKVSATIFERLAEAPAEG